MLGSERALKAQSAQLASSRGHVWRAPPFTASGSRQPCGARGRGRVGCLLRSCMRPGKASVPTGSRPGDWVLLFPQFPSLPRPHSGDISA